MSACAKSRLALPQRGEGTVTDDLSLGYIGLGNQGAPMAKRLVGWPGG